MAAVATGGVAITGVNLSKEKSVGSSLDDASIEAKIASKFFNEKELEDVYFNSSNQNILLTGVVTSEKLKFKAEDLVYQIGFVGEVYNEILVRNNGLSFSDKASNKVINNKILNKLFFAKNINSFNYYVNIIEGKVYLMGSAKSKSELKTVIELVKSVDGVKEIKSFVKIRG